MALYYYYYYYIEAIHNYPVKYISLKIFRKNSWISWPHRTSLAVILRNAGGSAREVETVSMRYNYCSKKYCNILFTTTNKFYELFVENIRENKFAFRKNILFYFCRFRNWNTRLTLTPSQSQSQNSSRLSSPSCSPCTR